MAVRDEAELTRKPWYEMTPEEPHGTIPPVPVRYLITRSGQVQAAPQGWPNRSRGVFVVDSHDRSRT